MEYLLPHEVNDIALCICCISAAILPFKLDAVTEPPLFDILNRFCFVWAKMWQFQRKKLDYEQLNNALTKKGWKYHPIRTWGTLRQFNLTAAIRVERSVEMLLSFPSLFQKIVKSCYALMFHSYGNY